MHPDHAIALAKLRHDQYQHDARQAAANSRQLPPGSGCWLASVGASVPRRPGRPRSLALGACELTLTRAAGGLRRRRGTAGSPAPNSLAAPHRLLA
jgi:hypothetical protein